MDDVATTTTNSLPPFQAHPKAPCSACLDLDYELFEQPPYFPLLFTVGMRCRLVAFRDIKKAAMAECRLCDILYRGITIFCNDVEKDEEGKIDSQATFDMESSTAVLKLRLGKPLWVNLIPSEGKHYLRYQTRNRLEFFTEHAIVPQHLSLDRCITLLEDWLHECKTRHEYCLAALPKLPKRLLYVAEETPRLVETDGLAYSRYTTLSHCWGKERDMIKTTGANLRLRTIGIESGELPQIFKDAISVTKLIGCQWIWIDSLCIVQDDKADWEEESTKMADVYSNSFLNIATTFSDSSLRSCFSNRKIIGFDSNDPVDRRELEWPVKSIGIAGDPGLFVRASHLTAHQHIADSSEGLRSTAAPLLERAWIFQERLLAPRTLHFDSTELIWECNTTLACECNMIAETRLTENRQKHKFAAVCQDRISNDQEILDLWLATVRIYSSLGLTKLSDRPYALAGIASRISDKLHSSYLAGIWAGDLPRALLWNIFVPKEDKPRPSSLSLGYPTWSWMSQYDPDHSNGSGVYYDSDIKVFVQDPRLEIHHSNTFCTYPNNNNDPFGAVLSGHLDITSATVQGKVIIADKSWYLFKAQTGWRGGSLVLDCPKVDGVENGAEVLCLLIGKMTQVIQALLLKLLHGSTNYIRVGYIQFHESKVDEVEVMRVQIV